MSRLSFHPHDTEWLDYADGEVSAESRKKLEEHLQGCWKCRAHVRELEGSIDAYVQFWRQDVLPGVPEPPHHWKNLRGEFGAIDSEYDGRWRGLRLPWLAAGGLVAALAAATAFYVGRPATPAPAAVPVPRPAQQVVPPSQVAKRQPLEAPPAVADGNVELAVFAALRRLEADLGEAIEVTRTPIGAVTVSLVALPEARMAEIESALRPMAGVAVRRVEAMAPAAAATRAPVVSAGHLLFEGELRAHFGSRAAQEHFTDQVLAHCDATMARIYALENLIKRFGTTELTAAERATLQRLRGEHRAVAVQEFAALRRALGPLLVALHAPGGSPKEPRAMTESARRLDDGLQVLLAGAPGERTSLLEQLSTAMAELDVTLGSGR